jgi:Sulfotransferase family
MVRALPQGLAARMRVPDLVDRRCSEPRLVWKSINSVGRLGALARLLPNARCILLMRHPCGQIASVLRGYVSGQIQGPPPSEHFRVFEMLLDTDQARVHGLTMDALRAMHPVERMAWRWVLMLEKAVADTTGLANCRLLRYEDLCAAPVEGARELFGFTGLGWHSRTEEFIRASTDGESDRYFGLHKNPGRSASKWQNELSQANARRIFDVVDQSPVGRLYPEKQAEPSKAAWPMAPVITAGLSLPF